LEEFGMTGYTVHTGSNEKFTEGWDHIFSKGKQPAAGKKKAARAKAAAKAKRPAKAKKKK
jgi:hypothetical protein